MTPILFSKLVNFWLVFIPAVIIARFFAFFAEKMEVSSKITAINSGQITTLEPVVLAFTIVVLIPISLILFWPVLVKSDKIHLRLSANGFGVISRLQRYANS